MFDEARIEKNCIIFIEELDALCDARNEDMNKEDLKTLTELLTQMDGFNDNTGIFIIGTTNQINLIDKAVLRPKRFDRIIKVEKPNEENRRKIFELYLGKMQCDETIDTEKYAIKTIGMNGAELENICNEAGILAVDRDKDKISEDEIMYMIKKTLEIDTTQNFLEDEVEEKHIGFI